MLILRELVPITSNSLSLMLPISDEFAKRRIARETVFKAGLVFTIKAVQEESFDGHPYLCFLTDASETEGLSFNSFTKIAEGRFLQLQKVNGVDTLVPDSVPTRRRPQGTATVKMSEITASVAGSDDPTYGHLATAAESLIGRKIEISAQATYVDKSGREHTLRNFDFKD